MTTPYSEIFSGTAEVSTTLVFFANSGVIPAFTPLMLEPVNGIMVPWDGKNSGNAVFLTPHAIDTTTQRRAQVYKSGTFNVDVINWPVTDPVLTLEKKIAAFAGAGLSVQPLAD